MGKGKSWINFALDTVRSMWHFHMDLLEMWRGEMGGVSLAAFVMRASGDLVTLRTTLDYYELVIRLAAFDTGIDPLVSIYDGEIRSDPVLYKFFSAVPLYGQVSGAYYSSALRGTDVQFTEQFVGNFALIWGLFIPTATAHALTQNPKALFDSRAHHVLKKRYQEHANSGDFFKWASQAYSEAWKNYNPFITSPFMWRVYNPLIDLYAVTLFSHIHLLSAMRACLPEAYIKPFIEGQKTRTWINGQYLGLKRLYDKGIIELEIPREYETELLNVAELNTYSLKIEIPYGLRWYSGFFAFAASGVAWQGASVSAILDKNTGTVFGASASIIQGNCEVLMGAHFGYSHVTPLKITIHSYTACSPYSQAWVGVGCVQPGNQAVVCEYRMMFGHHINEFHIPPRQFFAVMVYTRGGYATMSSADSRIKEVVIETEPEQEEYPLSWQNLEDYDPIGI